MMRAIPGIGCTKALNSAVVIGYSNAWTAYTGLLSSLPAGTARSKSRVPRRAAGTDRGAQ
jgi:hypothetical protein